MEIVNRVVKWLTPNKSPDAQVVTPEMRDKTFDKSVGNLFGLRRGMWVMHAQGVGIITALHDASKAVVMLTTPEGTDRLMIVCPAAELRQARWSEIPIPRRKHYEALREYGYQR